MILVMIAGVSDGVRLLPRCPPVNAYHSLDQTSHVRLDLNFWFDMDTNIASHTGRDTATGAGAPGGSLSMLTSLDQDPRTIETEAARCRGLVSAPLAS